jgi:hypothetical protein
MPRNSLFGVDLVSTSRTRNLPMGDLKIPILIVFCIVLHCISLMTRLILAAAAPMAVATTTMTSR